MPRYVSYDLLLDVFGDVTAAAADAGIRATEEAQTFWVFDCEQPYNTQAEANLLTGLYAPQVPNLTDAKAWCAANPLPGPSCTTDPQLLATSQNPSPSTAQAVLTIPPEFGQAAGRLAIAIAANDNASNGNAFGNPAGWTPIQQGGSSTADVHIGAWWRLSTGSGDPTTVTVPFLLAGDGGGTVSVWDGVNQANPVPAFGTVADFSQIARNTIPSVVTPVDCCVAISCNVWDGFDAGDFISNPIDQNTGLPWSALWTMETLATNHPRHMFQGGGCQLVWAYRTVETAGPSEAHRWQVSSAQLDGQCGFQFCIAPA